MSKSNGSDYLTCGVIVVMLLLVFGGIILQSFWNEEVITITVNKAERTSGQKGTYLVFTDGETFCVKDRWLRGSIDSSDRYGKIKPGASYKVTVVGMRIRIISSYRNLLVVDEIKPKEEEVKDE